MNPRNSCRSRRRALVGLTFALVAGLAVPVVVPVVGPTPPVSAAPAGDDSVVAFIVRGVGNGHGRGASQWGMYGRSLAGQTYQSILDTYYGGTSMGSRTGTIRVRLTDWDGASTFGVISATGTAKWNGIGNYASIKVEPNGSGGRAVYGSGSVGCPGDNLAWVLLDPNAGSPIRFSTDVSEDGAAPGDVLGACAPDGAITHYRGSLELRAEDGRRVVNQVSIENYLRGVIPEEVFPSWGDTTAGMESLKAQAVAARSFGVSQGRYSYAGTCDTSSCQVYGGSATRSSATANFVATVEHANTNAAIAATSGQVRVWPNGTVVSTEFSASNGPQTAGGTFPSVVDPYDDQPGNPNHYWTRVIDADAVMSRYGLGHANAVRTENDPTVPYVGIWDNRVNLGNGTTVSAWDFRNAFGFPSPGFELVPVRRTITNAATFAFIGDSIGSGMAMGSDSELQILTEGSLTTPLFDAVAARATQGGLQPDGVAVAQTVPIGTDLVVVELGYNDVPGAMASRIDAMMTALRARQVGLVAWVNVSERRTSTNYAATNAAIGAARSRWSELVVLDWQAASRHSAANRWFTDGVHLTPSGDAEFSLWLRDRIIGILKDGYTPPRRLLAGQTLRVPVLGKGGVPGSGVGAVALNVTAVLPSAAGHATVWPCGLPRPDTSSVNFLPGGVYPNAVVVPVDSTGEVCVWTHSETDVLVDVSAWMSSAVGVGVASARLIDTRHGIGTPAVRLPAGQTLRVPVLGKGGVPGSGVGAVALNVTAVLPSAAGHATVWPCGLPRPDTSSVNFLPGGVYPNAVVVPVDSTGEVCVWTHSQTDVLVDVSAWMSSAVGVGVASARLIDTRHGIGTPAVRLPAGQTLRVPVLGKGGVPGSGVGAVALNVTAVLPSAAGHATVWPCGLPRPDTSSVNFLPGGVYPNAVVVPVDSTGEVCVWTHSQTDVLVDVSAWFGGAGSIGVASSRLVDTRHGIGPIPPR